MTDPKITPSLAGLVVSKGGKLEKQDFIDYVGYDIDEYQDIVFNEEEAKKISNYLKKASTGSSTFIPLHCEGSRCPVAGRCPLVQMNKAPLGKMCLIEVQLLKEWLIRYLEEYEVDANNFTEIGYCNELAEIEVLLTRLNLMMSSGGRSLFVIEQTTGFSNQGIPIVQQQLSPYLEVKEKLIARKSKIIKLMVGDRQEKYKKEAALKQKNTQDPSSKMARLRKHIESLEKSLDSIGQANPDQQQVLEGKRIDQLEQVLTPDAILASVDVE